MSVFSRDDGMPSWAECISMLGFGFLGLVVMIHHTFRRPRATYHEDYLA